MNRCEWKNVVLGREFDQYILEHPEFAKNIPRKALIALQVEGDQEFNTWSRRLAQAQAETNQPIVYVIIKKMQPLRSRIEQVELAKAVA